MSGAVSPILGIPQVSPNQNLKEVTINNAVADLEAASNAVLILSFAAATTVTLTLAQFASAQMFRAQGLTASSTLTVPLSARDFAVRNEGTFTLTIGGATGATVQCPANTTVQLQNDGTDTLLVTSSEGANPGVQFANPSGNVGGTATLATFSTFFALSSPSSGAINVTFSSPLPAIVLTSPTLAADPPTNDKSELIPSTQWVQNYLAAQGYVSAGTAPVTSVNSQTGAVELSLSSLPGQVPWTGLPAEAQELPIPFVIGGLPQAGATFNLPIVASYTIPASFTGTQSYAGTKATAAATFTLSYLRSGNATQIGTISFAAGAQAATYTASSATTLQAGDVLILTAPSSQDSTLANIGITVLAAKV